VRFGDIFAASTSDITLDLSRASLGHAARHRSKRARRERRNVVSFTQDIVESSSSSSDDEDEDLASRIEHSRSMSMAASEMHGHGGDLAGQLERMAVELDAHVRLVRRGAETLATGSESGSDAYSMLAFALEDWDR
jgi:gamma-tubulin complex component 5